MELIRKENLRTVQGIYKTRSLFFEMVLSDKEGCVYTLKPEDHEGFPSLKRLYLEAMDPTEYTFANEYLAGWDHWLKLLECDWFTPYIEQWRIELELKIKAEAFRSIASESKDTSSRNRFLANKYLLESYRKATQTEDDKPGKGRPSKDQINSEALRIAVKSSDIIDDFDRIAQRLS
jgi:hypothetical protein